MSSCEAFKGAIRLLTVAMLFTCAGVATATFRGDGTSINSFLFLALGLSHEAAASVERLVLGAVLAAAIIGAIRPSWAALLPVAGYLLAESVAGWHQGGYHFSEWSPLARAPTYIVPLSLACLAGSRAQTIRARERRRQAAMWALRLAASAVFLAHGLEALKLHPRFIDLILTSGYNLFGVRMSETAASALLRIIGVVDIAVAVAVVIRPWRVLLGWMAFWAGLAAVSRMTSFGWGAYPDLLVRAVYILAPLALWALLRDNKPPSARAP